MPHRGRRDAPSWEILLQPLLEAANRCKQNEPGTSPCPSRTAAVENLEQLEGCLLLHHKVLLSQNAAACGSHWDCETCARVKIGLTNA